MADDARPVREGGKGETAPGERVRFGHIKKADLAHMALAELEWIVQHAARVGWRFKAAKEILAREWPVPAAPAVVVQTGPVVIRWKSSSTTPPDPSRPSSIASSSDGGPAKALPSATDDSASR